MRVYSSVSQFRYNLFIKRSVSNLSSSVRNVCAHLRNRAVLCVEGADAFKFLQGLITNDVSLVRAGSSRRSLFAAMLNSQGRILYDLFVYPWKSLKTTSTISDLDSSFLLECDASLANEVMQHMLRYKLRSKIVISDLSNEFHVWSLFGLDLNKENCLGDYSSHWYPDPRVFPLLGWRGIFPAFSPPPYPSSISLIQMDHWVYQVYRMLHGIPEGSSEFWCGHSLPQESNLDLLNAISYEKGCYLGQEFIARTKRSGVIRKRLFPMTTKALIDSYKSDITSIGLSKELSLFPSYLLKSNTMATFKRNPLHTIEDQLSIPCCGCSIFLESVRTGTIRSSFGCLGLATVRLEHVLITHENHSKDQAKEVPKQYDGIENLLNDKVFLAERFPHSSDMESGIGDDDQELRTSSSTESLSDRVEKSDTSAFLPLVILRPHWW